LKREFRARLWISWAHLIIFGGLGVFAMTFGVLMWTGRFRNIYDEPVREGGPPCFFTGVGMTTFAGLAFYNIIASSGALIGCFREGIQCKLVARTELDSVPLVPGMLRIAFAIVTGQGFRMRFVRYRWEHFAGAHVTGGVGTRNLMLDGAGLLDNGKPTGGLVFPQVQLRDDVEEIAAWLNAWSRDAEQIQRFPSWND
jgi:hypothetical protein